jgi:hypothetical protein
VYWLQAEMKVTSAMKAKTFFMLSGLMVISKNINLFSKQQNPNEVILPVFQVFSL